MSKETIKDHRVVRVRGSNRDQMHDRNRALVLNLIRVNQPISRTDLVRETGLTKGTISNIVGVLIERNLVREIQHGSSTGGRRPTLLKLAAEQNLVGAIDVRPRLTTLAIATLDGHFIRRSVILTDARHPTQFLIRCMGQIKGMLDQFDQHNILGIGLVIPGYMDVTGRKITHSAILNWRDIDLSPLFAAVPFAVHIINDAHAVALAEHVFGNKQGWSSFGHIVLQSDGLRLGIVKNGTLLRGDSNQAGNIAHMVIDSGGDLCACGRQGCLGLYASGEGVARRYQRLVQRQYMSVKEETGIYNLKATNTEEGIHLCWDSQLPDLAQFGVYRHVELPVPTDAIHCIGFTSECQFIDHIDYEGEVYYSVCIVENDGRSGPAETVKSRHSTTNNLLFDDKLSTDVISQYQVLPEVTLAQHNDGIVTGSNIHGVEETRMWREDLGAGIFTGIVRPLKKGQYDTCGILFKYKDSTSWYCAVLAYGTDLVSKNTLALMRQNGSSTDEWLGFFELNVELGEDYRIKVFLDKGWVRVKAWQDDTDEPSDWQIVIRDDVSWEGGGVGFRCYGEEVLLRSLKARQLPLQVDAMTTRPAQYDYSDTTISLLMQRAHLGDQLALRILRDTGQALGVGLANIHTILDLEAFYYTGSLLDEELPGLKQALTETIEEASGASLGFAPSSLGSDASLLGAVAVASESVFGL